MEALERSVARLQEIADAINRRIQTLQAQNNKKNPNHLPPIQNYTHATPDRNVSRRIHDSSSLIFAPEYAVGIAQRPSGPPLPPANPGGWQVWSCCALWFGLKFLLGGIGMVTAGSIILANLKPMCPSGYTAIRNQCCYTNSPATYYNYCYTDNSQDPTYGIVLVCVGAVSMLIGFGLLFRSNRLYLDHNYRCC